MELYTFGQLSEQAKQVAVNEIRARLMQSTADDVRKAKDAFFSDMHNVINDPKHIRSIYTSIKMNNTILDRIDMVFGLHPWFDTNGKFYNLIEQNA